MFTRKMAVVFSMFVVLLTTFVSPAHAQKIGDDSVPLAPVSGVMLPQSAPPNWNLRIVAVDDTILEYTEYVNVEFDITFNGQTTHLKTDTFDMVQQPAFVYIPPGTPVTLDNIRPWYNYLYPGPKRICQRALAFTMPDDADTEQYELRIHCIPLTVYIPYLASQKRADFVSSNP